MALREGAHRAERSHGRELHTEPEPVDRPWLDFAGTVQTKALGVAHQPFRLSLGSLSTSIG
jgi:hypothetical protein